MHFSKYAFLLVFLAVGSGSALRAQCHGGSDGHDGGGSQSSHGDSEPTRLKAVNTICPVLGSPVKQGKDLEVVLAGKLYLVCCQECRVELAKNRGKYLDVIGRPKNASQKAKERQPAEPASEHQH